MDKTLLTIQKASELLGVSTKTLRRWDKAGKLKPKRTKGNQRRYDKDELLKFQSSHAKPTGSPDSGNFGFKPYDVSKTEPQLINSGHNITQPEPRVIEPLDRVSYAKMELFNLSFAKKAVLGSFSVVFLSLLFLASSKYLGMKAFDQKIANYQQNPVAAGNSNQAVLAAATENQNFQFSINVPSNFSQSAQFLKDITVEGSANFKGPVIIANQSLDLGNGTVTASNVVYGITAGDGLSVSGGQNPKITNTGVVSLAGKTGVVDLEAGDGITIDGVKISNSDTGSSQKIFKNFVVGSQTITAGSNTDTLNFNAGTGVTLTSDTASKTITISSNQSGSSGVTSLNTQTGAVTIAAGNGLSLSGLTFANTGVLSLGGQTGALSLVSGNGISISGLTVSNSGVLSLAGTAGDLLLGTGLSLTGSTINNTGVTSLGGLSGGLTLGAGTGISISGLTITNLDPGSSQNIFKNIAIGTDTIVAGSNNDTLNFTAGSNISLSTDTGNKTVTISSNVTGLPTPVVGNLLGVPSVTNLALNKTATVSDLITSTPLITGFHPDGGQYLSAIVDAASGSATVTLSMNNDGAAPLVYVHDILGYEGGWWAAGGTTTVAAGPIYVWLSAGGHLNVISGTLSYQPSHTADKVVDGDVTTYWESGNKTAGTAWTTVDLGSATPIGAYRVVSAGSSDAHRFKAYKIQSSPDGSTWTDRVAAGDGWAPDSGVVSMTTTTARYWRFISNQTTEDTPRLYSFELYSGIAWSALTSSQVQAMLSLVPGTNIQPFDSDLSSIAALSTTSFGRSFLTLTDPLTALSTLGIPTATSPFAERSGAIIPLNSTEDLLLGGQSSSSAKFAFLNNTMARGLQIASVSGGLTLDSSAAAIQTTNNQLLTIGGNTTGDIQFKPGNTAGLYLSSTGNVGVGTTTPDSSLQVLTNDSTTNSISTILSLTHRNGSTGFTVDTGSSLPTNLLSYFKNDESSGTTIADSVGSNNLTATGTTVVSGKLGNARSYAGNSSSYSNIINPSGLPIGAAPRSVFAWVKLNSTSTAGIVSWGIGQTSRMSNLDIISGRVGFGGYNTDFSGSTPLTTGVWYLIGYTYDGSAVRLYLNGSSDGSPNTVTLNTPTSNLGVGYDLPQGTFFFNGAIDEVGIWTKALSQQEITDLYNSGAADAYSTGASANGIGAGLAFENPNSSGTNLIAARIAGLLTNITAGSENGALTFETINNGGLLIERARIDSSGSLGIGTNTPGATLDVRGNSGTTAVTSISGSSSFATLAVNNSGVGDLFTASSSGLPKFTIKNDGTVVASAYSGCSLTTDANGLVTCGTGLPTPIIGDFLGVPAVTDLALNETVTSDSVRNSNQPSYAVDGNPATGWQTNNKPAGTAWIRVDLGSATSIGAYRVVTASGTDPQRFKGYKIQSSPDGLTWTDRATVVGEWAPDSGVISFTPASARYWRFINTETTEWEAMLYTFQLYSGVAWSALTPSQVIGMLGITSSPYTVLNGAIIPLNSTEDFLLGGQSTASADFSLTGLLNNQLLASVSGQLSIMPNNGWGGQVGLGTSNFGNGGGSLLALANIGAAPSATANQGFLYVSNGSLKYQGPSTLTSLANADYAESMPFVGELDAADIVSVSSQSKTDADLYNNFQVERSSTSYDSKLIGIVSQASSNSTTTKLIAMVGRVPVKVTSENGPIKPGDEITSSTQAGVGMKATAAGMVVGKALQSYDNADPTAIGQVLVFVNVGWYDPASQIAFPYDPVSNSSASASLASVSSLALGNATFSAIMVTGKATVNDLGVTGKINSGLLVIDGLDSSISGGATSINTLSGDLYLQNEGWGGVNILAGKVTIDTNGNVNVTGVLGAKTVKTENLIIKGNGSIGSAVLPSGETTLEIDTASVNSNSKVFITPTSLTSVPLSVTSKSSGKFTVQIKEAQNADIKFDWWVVGTE